MVHDADRRVSRSAGVFRSLTEPDNRSGRDCGERRPSRTLVRFECASRVYVQPDSRRLRIHDYVRPEINALLDREEVSDHTYLLPEEAAPVQRYTNDALWSRAFPILSHSIHATI